MTGYFFRVKSTLTTFDPSSGFSSLVSADGSFSASSCSSAGTSAESAWKVSANSTAFS